MRFFSPEYELTYKHQLFFPMMETPKYQKKMNYQYYFLLTKYRKPFHRFKPNFKLFLVCISCLLKKLFGFSTLSLNGNNKLIG